MKLKPFDSHPTPEDWDELVKYIKGHNKNQWSLLLTVACRAWNLACKLSQDKDS